MASSTGPSFTAPEVVEEIRRAHARWPGGMSRQELADRAGLSKAYVVRFLQGRQQNPTLGTVVALAAALGFRFRFSAQPVSPEEGE